MTNHPCKQPCFCAPRVVTWERVDCIKISLGSKIFVYPCLFALHPLPQEFYLASQFVCNILAFKCFHVVGVDLVCSYLWELFIISSWNSTVLI